MRRKGTRLRHPKILVKRIDQGVFVHVRTLEAADPVQSVRRFVHRGAELILSISDVLPWRKQRAHSGSENGAATPTDIGDPWLRPEPPQQPRSLLA
jgi:hypothetical protein